MSLVLRKTRQFEKDVKRMAKRGMPLRELTDVIDLLLAQTPLPEKHRDHPLVGDYIGFRECHIRPDWLLIYTIQAEKLILTCTRTGTHSDLF
ncbi:MAG: type II toxin-antitoxin system YafQ family toxin [Kiritimatiellae bacterium]|nr:type II toxin-antitoxin system YafQ family toxin [Kiritimatiellia bacterium]